MKKRFLYNKDYAKATAADIFDGKAKDKIELTCTETRTCVFENKGGGKFEKHPLPAEAQFAPVNSIIADHIDKDTYIDLLLAGNEYQADVMTGRYDASYGCFLKGNGKGFTVVPPAKSGLILQGDIKSMAVVHTTGKAPMLAVAVNNDSLRLYRRH